MSKRGYSKEGTLRHLKEKYREFIVRYVSMETFQATITTSLYINARPFFSSAVREIDYLMFNYLLQVDAAITEHVMVNCSTPLLTLERTCRRVSFACTILDICQWSIGYGETHNPFNSKHVLLTGNLD
jgi:hypothetical protein